MLYTLIGDVGSGKTLASVCILIDYLKTHKNVKIFANFHLNPNYFKNFTFTKYLFIPYSDIHDCVIIGDDFYNLSLMGDLTGIISSMSRKRDIFVILTCQYYTMIKPIIRNQATWEIRPEIYKWDKENLSLLILNKEKEFRRNEYKQETDYIQNPIQRFGHLYETKEVVAFNLESELLNEILMFSNTLTDLELNCSIVFKNKSIRERNFRKLKMRFIRK